MFGHRVDISRVGAAGLRFKHTHGSPFQSLEGYEGVYVRFSMAGKRMSGSSFRYGRDLHAPEKIKMEQE